MKLISLTVILFSLLLLSGGSSALAAGETASLSFQALPMKAKFQKKRYLPARLSWGVQVRPAENQLAILPMRVARLQFPGALRFFPRKGLEPCRLSEPELVGPSEVVYERCPNSVVGNGEATFQLAQITSPLALRRGTIVILYGGRVGRDVRIRFSAWSGDTSAGIVADGILRKRGQMEVRLPVLTADSAVTSLRLQIPGKKASGTWDSGGAWTLRAGSDRGFARMRCRMGARLGFSARLLLGARNALGVPYGPENNLSPKTRARCGRS